MRYKIIKENPLQGCSIKNFTNGAKHYISLEETKTLLNHMKNSEQYHNYYRILLFLAFCGCRIGEVLGLQQDGLDVDNCIVEIKAQVTNYHFSRTLKTKSSLRKIKIPQFVMQEISKNLPKSDFVFVNSKGGSIGYKSFTDNLKKACNECGIEYRSPKQFRNSFVKTAILNSVPLKVLQNILGHSRYSTTADIYGELECEDTFFVAEKMQQAYQSV